MLHIDELLNIANETGYHLCSLASCDRLQYDQKRVFSAQFDVNFGNLLYIFSQTGEIDVLDIQTETRKSYIVKFRHATALPDIVSGQSEQIIKNHWDKVTTIPNRPGELIFVLGVSNKLMYTALPGGDHNRTLADSIYPKEPFLSSTTRGDFGAYEFGSAILEISTHNARITAMRIAFNGHILATGDESGKVKLLLLQLIDQETLRKKQQKKYSTLDYYPFQESYELIESLHSGPIFSLEWLPVVFELNDAHQYCLVTGSLDYDVRLWIVSACTKKGLSILPFINLHIPSSHILCLSSYSIVMSNSIDQNRPISSDAAIFLMAGTNAGTVHCWKWDKSWLKKTMTESISSSQQSSILKLPDNGQYLHSFLQSSNRPIVHLGMTSVASDYLILVAADVTGVVMYHRSNYQNNLYPPFVYIKSIRSESPIVSCCFHQTQLIHDETILAISSSHLNNPSKVRTDPSNIMKPMWSPSREFETANLSLSNAFNNVDVMTNSLVARLNKSNSLDFKPPTHVEHQNIESTLWICELNGNIHHFPSRQLLADPVSKSSLKLGLDTNASILTEEDLECSPRMVPPPRPIQIDHPSAFERGTDQSNNTLVQYHKQWNQIDNTLPSNGSSEDGTSSSMDVPQPDTLIDDTDPHQGLNDLNIKIVPDSHRKKNSQRNHKNLQPFPTSDTQGKDLESKQSFKVVEKVKALSVLYQNDYATPKINSSKVIEYQLTKLGLDPDIPIDEGSVITIQTSQSDRVYAAHRLEGHQELSHDNQFNPTDVRRLKYGRPDARYTDLRDIQESTEQIIHELKSSVGQSKAKATKQVDKTWLHRKQNEGPSEEDMKVWLAPDPIVNFKMLSQPFPTPAAELKYTKKEKLRQEYNRQYGLHCEINETNLLPQFTIEMNFNDIFHDDDPIPSADDDDQFTWAERYRFSQLSQPGFTRGFI